MAQIWTIFFLAVICLTLTPPGWAQTQSSAPIMIGQNIPTVNTDSDDPIDDRGLIEHATGTVIDAWTWLAYTFGTMFEAVTPPTPSAMVRDLQNDNDRSTFFQMISDAGYKIKEIENGVGLPPTITIKFGRIRNLSDADIDYMDRALERWAKKEPGIVGDAERAAIRALVAINQSDSFIVDAVTMRVLPLPQFRFSLAPTIGGLGWEGSQIMRAIQRLDHRVATMQKSE